MGRRIRIPGLVDVLLVDRPAEILAVADHPALDRGPTSLGPVLNRLILGIALKTLRTDRTSLPSARPRGDAERKAAQQALAGRLAPENAPWDPQSLLALANWLKGRRAPLGPLCQQAIGRLFVADFRATRETWHAATVLNTALSSRNPVRRLLWTVTDEVGFAQRTLSRSVDGDPAAVHAIGIAVHTFRRAIERLDALLADPVKRRAISTRGALGAAMAAPDTVVRHSSAHAETAAGAVAPGTLVLLSLDSAVRRSADRRIAFLRDSWSACPAHRLVPAMLAEIWCLATGERELPERAA